ncbi:MAG: ABC transporter permease [Candidatus Paceibacterota bacterium]
MTVNYSGKKILRKLLPVFGVIVFISIWEVNSYFNLYHLIAPSLSPTTFPSFLSISERLCEIVASVDFWNAARVTVARTLAGFGISMLLGTVLGLLAGRVQLIGVLVNIPVEFFRNLPAIAAMPILILFLGIGTSMKVALCVFGSLFPILIATTTSMQNISEDIHIAARFYGWSGWRLLFIVLLPSALPEIAASGQTALSISLILAVMGEMLIGGDGLGSMIVDAERTFNNLNLYALVMALGIFGCLLAFGLRLIVNRLIFWKVNINWQQS